MERRKALATAAAITATALAATIALGTNAGLFGLANDPGGPGTFEPVGEPSPPVVATERTEVIDVPVPHELAGQGGTTDVTRADAEDSHEAEHPEVHETDERESHEHEDDD